jgi:NAD(P)-dependent dehydrogenase (short-subunit alcohol dehydrogenase family)
VTRPANPAALVTGGAQGIGRAIAARLASDGSRVALLDINPAVVEVAAELNGIGIKVDLADSEATSAAVGEAIGQLGGLWILINNAGIFAKTPLLEIDPAAWDEMMAVNVRSMLVTTQAAAPTMIAAGSGRIVNQASMAAKLGTPGEAHYAASKAAVTALTRIAAQELGPHDITVNCLCPGYVLTEMGAATRDPEQIREWSALSPLGRLGSTEDVAGAVAYLASDDAAYVTGQSLNINGGMCTW